MQNSCSQVRYDKLFCMRLKDVSQLDLLHRTKNKEEKLKTKADMLGRNSLVKSVLREEKSPVERICERRKF